MPAPINRASITIVKDADFEMVKVLSQLSGSSISNFCGTCLSEYLQQNYHRLHDFYASAPKPSAKELANG